MDEKRKLSLISHQRMLRYSDGGGGGGGGWIGIIDIAALGIIKRRRR
jgi:hypothetical protein